MVHRNSESAILCNDRTTRIAMCIASREANAVVDIGSKDLLGALVVFLQPLIEGQGKKSSPSLRRPQKSLIVFTFYSSHYSQQSKLYGIFSAEAYDIALIGNAVDLNGTPVIDGLEGKNLLSALTAFVIAVVNPPSKVHSERGKLFKFPKYTPKFINCY